MNFKTVEQAVEHILGEKQETRADDMLLYLCYLDLKKAPTIHTMFNRDFRIKNGIASYETVSRVRRKLQARYRWLRPTPKEIAERRQAEKEYRKYARGRG